MKRLLPLLLLLLTFSSPASAQTLPPEGLPVPQIVAIAGTFQDDLGCSGEWTTDCEDTYLALDGNSLLWRGSFQIPAGSHEYKVALNGAWTDNFGLGGEYYGKNIPLELAEDTLVTFYYSHETHFVTDDVNAIIASVPGSFQDEIGCAGDWAPDCLRSWLQDPDGDGLYTWSTTWIPKGDYEAKVALNGAWTDNFGSDGTQDGPNLPFSVGDFEQVTFTWDSVSHIISVETAPAPEGAPTSAPVYTVSTEKSQPATVTIAGTIQPLAGCEKEWDPPCANTFLTFDDIDRIWEGEWMLPAGDYEYKAALNQTWDVNFGLNATPGGGNILLSIAAEQAVKFYYDHETSWVTDNVNSLIPVVTGNFQAALGCETDNNPTCLRSWLEDPNGDGIYDRLIEGIPVGDYTARVALGETETYATEETTFSVDEEGSVVFMQFDSATNEFKVQAGAPKGDLATQLAHWVLADTIAWDVDTTAATTFQLVSAPDGGLELDPAGVVGGTSITLTLDPAGFSAEVTDKYPHLSPFAALKLNPADLEKVPDLLKGQITVAAFNTDGRPVDATSLQIPGVLDDLYTYDGALGLTWENDIPTFRVWAPTTRSVTLNIYQNSGATTFPQARDMTLDLATGVWSFTGEAGWKGKYYAYEVVVFVPSTGLVETNVVTDPYSVGLSTNGFRSLVVDLNDPELLPAGWAEMVKPPLNAPEDIVLYEMHIRDFSVNDQTVPEEFRGTYKAFSILESNGMKHLAALAQAGLTHLHILPAFDMASVNEDKTTWPTFDFAELAALPGDSEEQQALFAETKSTDSFNWGYDPVHYGVPDGSYATNPEDATRILEFREMVQGVNQVGLRFVMDVVYNHTNASGQRPNSVLDQIVPGYYYRLNDKGQVETSTCCQNTATEHTMMRKLMIDTLVQWATEYNVAGFRFDLMGHHMVSDMVAVRDALQAIDPTIYIYGEGWDFGEVAGGARGENATQLNMGGTGIGTFNDRVRDSVRGGSPFGDYLKQGFATGLYTDPNEAMNGDAVEQIQLNLFADRIRTALAGNLAAFTFTGADGTPVTGADVDYNGSPTGYTQDPQEQIVYISAHDNEIWFDAVQYKAPADATLADRTRMDNLGISLVGLSQGIPFFTAGDDMLRSKSFDKDSYDSGDWFNRLDFTYTDNGFGSGLPIADKNQENWPLQAPLLGNPDLKPTQENILAAVAHFQETLQIRKSSPLFRLQTAEEIMNRVFFHNTGPDQIPGLIVMSLHDNLAGEDLDPNYDQIVVIFNATPETQSYIMGGITGFKLHPILANSADEVVRTSTHDTDAYTFTVPGRTTAVFVLDEVPVQLDLPTAEPAPTKVATPTSEPTPALSEETETPMNTYAVGALIGLVVVFGLAAWARMRRGKGGSK